MKVGKSPQAKVSAVTTFGVKRQNVEAGLSVATSSLVVATEGERQIKKEMGWLGLGRVAPALFLMVVSLPIYFLFLSLPFGRNY